MFITDLFEAQDPYSTIVIYPGRFQPWHKGHKSVYDHLVKTFGRDNVFIATSNKVDPPRSPFNFGEKVQFMHLTGVPNDRIVETKDPYRALEIIQNYNPGVARLIFAVSEKDMAEDPRFKFGYKKDGSPTYLQAMPKNPSEMQPFARHGYVMTVPTFEFTVLGAPMRSATEVRAQFAGSDNKTQQAIIKDLFGRYSPEIHSLMKSKITLNEGQVIPFRRPQPQQLTWQQIPKDILKLANDWFWASEDNSGLSAVLDPEGYGNGTQNDVNYNAAKLQQKGWYIDYNDENDPPNEYNLVLKNKNGQTVLLSIDDAQSFSGWAKGTESGIYEGDYEYRPPGASASQTRKVMNKLAPKDNKFIWKKPNQIGGSFSEQDLLAQGFKKSQYNAWGGTQTMWNKLLGLNEQDSDPCWDNYKQIGMKEKNGKKVPNCVPKEGVAEGSGQEPGEFELYDTRTLKRVYHPFEANDIMDAFVKADDWLEAIGKSGRGLSVRPVREQGVAEGFTDDLDNIYAMHPQPEKSEQIVFFIAGMNEREFSQRWADLPDPYLNEFGYDLPLWNTDDLSRYPNLTVKRITFDQYVKLVGNYIKSEELTVSSMSKMKKVAAGDQTNKGQAANNGANRLREFTQGGNSGQNKWLQYIMQLAQAWYTHSLKGLSNIRKKSAPGAGGKAMLDNIIDVQERVEKIFQSGIRCPDGQVRKFEIGYNSNFDGVVIFSDDYYEYSTINDAGDEIDSRTGQLWSQYDYLEFNGRNLGGGIATEDAAGVGVIAKNKQMAKDPRYSMSITKDVKPGQDKKNLRAWRLIK